MVYHISKCYQQIYHLVFPSKIKADYEGDSIQNCLGDVFCASAGYWLCVGSVYINQPWIPLFWLILSELVLAYFIRDGLILIWIQVSLHLNGSGDVRVGSGQVKAGQVRLG